MIHGRFHNAAQKRLGQKQTAKPVMMTAAIALALTISAPAFMINNAATANDGTSLAVVETVTGTATAEESTATIEPELVTNSTAPGAPMATDEAPVTQAIPVAADEVHIDVPVIEQMPELPTGCEAVAVAMLINYAGVDISKFEVVEQMPYSIDDPDEGYVGDPYSTYGWTIYPAAFSQVVEDATGSFINLTGSSFDGLRKVLTQGKPVVCWAALHGFATHSIVITGYDADYIYYNDPWTGEKDAALGIDDFINVWDALGFRALSY